MFWWCILFFLGFNEDCYVICNIVDVKVRNYMKCEIELEWRNFVYWSSEENSGIVFIFLLFINILIGF